MQINHIFVKQETKDKIDDKVDLLKIKQNSQPTI